jgi:hypothetical protein
MPTLRLGSRPLVSKLSRAAGAVGARDGRGRHLLRAGREACAPYHLLARITLDTPHTGWPYASSWQLFHVNTKYLKLSLE